MGVVGFRYQGDNLKAANLMFFQMAQSLGLSTLGAEPESEDGQHSRVWTGRWVSLIQREVGRRIWWNLVLLDWTLAPSYSYSCSIQPDQSEFLSMWRDYPNCMPSQNCFTR